MNGKRNKHKYVNMVKDYQQKYKYKYKIKSINSIALKSMNFHMILILNLRFVEIIKS